MNARYPDFTALLGALMTAVCAMNAAAQVTEESFGKTREGEEVTRYTLKNEHGCVAKIMTLGAIVTELYVPDRHGTLADVVLGFDRLEPYLAGHPVFGAVVGRVANRIRDAKFPLDGRVVHVSANSGPNQIHGGRRGFHTMNWNGRILDPASTSPAIGLSYLSADGEEGFPGNLSVTVIYRLTKDNGLEIRYEAITDKPTPINLTNHSYFNLAGQGDVLDHRLTITAPYYTPADRALIPTGEIRSVKGTALDFLEPHAIGERIAVFRDHPGGYDHNYVLGGDGRTLQLAARVRDPKSGRVMECYTTQPGVQLYTGNGLNGRLIGPGGRSYPRYGGVCLETQHFPDSVNQRHFPNTILRPGEVFRATTVYRFSAQ